MDRDDTGRDDMGRDDMGRDDTGRDDTRKHPWPDGTVAPGLDPRFEKLIALLYGELPDAEAADLRRQIESDPALKEEWDELTATRSILARWEIPETTPDFVFLKDPARDGAGAAGRTASGRRTPLRERIRRAFGIWSWGMAATAAIVLVLALTQFRVEQVPGGLAFRFGQEPLPGAGSLQAENGRNERESVPSGALSLDSPASPRGATQPTDRPMADGPMAGRTGRLVSTGPDDLDTKYLTEEEFRAYVAGMTRTMVALFNEYGEQRDREMVAFVQAALGEVAKRHADDYQDLTGQIQTVGIGLAREQYETNSRVDLLLEQDSPARSLPVNERPASDSEGAR